MHGVCGIWIPKIQFNQNIFIVTKILMGNKDVVNKEWKMENYIKVLTFFGRREIQGGDTTLCNLESAIIESDSAE